MSYSYKKTRYSYTWGFKIKGNEIFNGIVICKEFFYLQGNELFIQGNDLFVYKEISYHIRGNEIFVLSYSYKGISRSYTEVNYSYKRMSVSEMSYSYTWGL